MVKCENSNLVADSHSILASWENHFSHLMHVHRVNDVWHTEIQTVEPLPLRLR
jgi:hypothetical protein